MRYTFIVLFIFYSKFSLCQQSSIRGIVSFQNSKTETGTQRFIPNAQVTDILDKANSVLTESDGSFDLVFASTDNGTSVHLIVLKQGLQVINFKSLDAVTGQSELVKISMTTPDKIADSRKLFYKVGKTQGEKHLELLLVESKQSLNALKKDTLKNALKILSLEEIIADLQNKEKDVDKIARELANQYAVIDLDYSTPSYISAFRFFQSGMFDSALAILNREQAANDPKLIRNEEYQLDLKKKEVIGLEADIYRRKAIEIPSLLMKISIFKIRFQIDSTLNTYRQLFELDSHNPEILFDYASYLGQANQNDSALKYYNILLNIKNTDNYTSSVLDAIGEIYYARGDYSKAETFLIRAIQNDQKDPDFTLPSVKLESTATLNALGTIMLDKDDLMKAEYFYFMALDILNKYPDKEYTNNKIVTLINISALYIKRGSNQQAEEVLKQSLALSEKIENPDTVLTELTRSSIFHHFGILYGQLKACDKAADAYNKELKIRLKLYRISSFLYARSYEEVLNQLGINYMCLQKYKKADSMFQTAIRIVYTLIRIDSSENFPLLASLKLNIGNNFALMKKYEKAESSLRGSYQLTIELAKKAPDVYTVYLARIDLCLADLFARKLDFNRADTEYKASLTIFEKLSIENQFYLREVNTLKTYIDFCQRKRKLFVLASRYFSPLPF